MQSLGLIYRPALNSRVFFYQFGMKNGCCLNRYVGSSGLHLGTDGYTATPCRSWEGDLGY